MVLAAAAANGGALYSVFGDGSDFVEEHTVSAHGTTTLKVVHTNSAAAVAKVIAMYEEWLQDPHQYKIVGLDLEYTGNQQHAALLQLCMRNHCLLYHVCRAKEKGGTYELRRFLRNNNISFVSVDISQDTGKLERDLHVHVGRHVDLQQVWHLEGDHTGRPGMARLAGDIIDPYYLSMKKVFPKILHAKWEWRHLHPQAIEYAARDAYVCYEMYRQILWWRKRDRGRCSHYH